ncbi:MAG: GrpB family protein [Lysobacter sp.]|nr:GrpB family protein [Lysobacter sp.]
MTAVADPRATEYMKLLTQLQKEIGEIHGEPILRRFRRWQKVKSPDVRTHQQDYDPAWPDEFSAGAAAIARALADHHPEIHHIGSTSVPGMASKPIVDMVVALDDSDAIAMAGARLSAIGYACWGNSPMHPDIDWFWHHRSTPVQRVVHLCARGNPWMVAAVNFRDYLRQFPQKRVEYLHLKQRLVSESGDDLALYSAKKTSLVHRFNTEAEAWRASARVKS